MSEDDQILIELANEILKLLEQEQEIEDTDLLYSDEFYISVMSFIFQDANLDKSPGDTSQERANNIDQLILFIENIVETDISHLSGQKVIERDFFTVKQLLELILELIQLLIKEQEVSESQHISGQDLIVNTQTDQRSDHHNQTNVGNRQKELSKSDNKSDEFAERFENDEEFVEEGQEEDINEEDEEERSMKENYSCPVIKNLEESNNTSSFGIKNNYSENDLTRYIQVMQYLHNQEEEQEISENHENLKISDSTKNSINNDVAHLLNNNEDNINFSGKEEEESKSINISHISEVSRSKENSEPPSNNKHLINKKDLELNSLNSKEKVHESYVNSRISSINENNNLNVRKAKTEEIIEDSYLNNEDISEINKSDLERTDKKRKSEQSSTTNNKVISERSLNGNENKHLKKNKSTKQLIKNQSRSDISVSSLHSNEPSFVRKSKRTSERSIYEELPLNDDNIKAEIMKEFRRLYGNKVDKLFLKNNLEKSSNLLELVLRNLRLAKGKLSKLKADRDPDDLITKEFLLKYRKELDYIINYYQKELRKREILKKKAVSTLSKNVNLLRKVQSIEEKNIEDELERRKKCREIKNKENHVKICKDIYSKALELERQKIIEENNIELEIRKQENEEKRKLFIEAENFYRDRISMLKDILRKERYERELQHRAQTQFFEKLERERKRNYKNQINKIFEKLDEEDRKYELDNNPDKIEDVLLKLYK